MAELRATLARNIRTLREGRGWSQADLAKKANVTPAAISHYETGSHGFSSDGVDAIARALGVEPTDLFYPGQLPKPVVIRPNLWEAVMMVGDAIRALQKGKIPEGTDLASLQTWLSEIEAKSQRRSARRKLETGSE